MTAREILHTIIFIFFGIVSLCNVKETKKPRKYINLAAGILALLIALLDILVTGLGLNIHI